MAKSSKDYGEELWRAENDMRTMAQAQEIMSNPARIKAAKAKAIETMKALMPIVCAPTKSAKTSKSKGSGNRLSMR